MKKFFCFSVILLLVACSDHFIQEETVTPSDVSITDHESASNMISVKFSQDIISLLDGTENEPHLPTGIVSLDAYLNSIGATRIRRIFPYAGKMEHRQVKEGLHAWYTIWGNSTNAAQPTRSSWSESVIKYMEPVRVPQLEDYKVYEAPVIDTNTRSSLQYNDPLWPGQWNLKNNGNFGNYTNSNGEQIVSSIAGADINIQPAWELTTGSPDVIVAIVDGGVDVGHEDLADNMWMNPGEIPDNGIDDDDNGYVDDIHGWNFVDDSNIIIPTDHGTHVAGIVAARNNNGLGICGIAGGDGTPDSGSRLMTCQIFKPNPNYNPNDPNSKSTISVDDYNAMAAAIVYGANNGAVISQNSWGFSDYREAPRVVREAITYFNNYAGQYDGSPMKGGLCIFSAGNDGTETPMYPAAYDDVVSVTAFAPGWMATFYTNYGLAADICAPGGTTTRGDKYPYAKGFQLPSLILSTVPKSVAASGYASMQGTSMACPHVSGIAALIVSKYKGVAFTRDELKERLLSGIHPLDPGSVNASLYKDRLGMGYANAAVALSDYDRQAPPPLPVFNVGECGADYHALHVAWSANVSQADALQCFTLYYSPQPITAGNLQDEAVGRYRIPAGFVGTGQHDFSRTISRLGNDQGYYFALAATSRGGKVSDLIVLPEKLTTLHNTAPQVTANIDITETVHIAGNDALDVVFDITDVERHKWTYELSNPHLFYIEERGSQILVRIFANKFGTGPHTVTMVVTDEYGAETVVPIHFVKDEDKAPVLKKELSVVRIGRGAKKVIDMRELVADEDTEKLSFMVHPLSGDAVKSWSDGHQLTIEGSRVGTSTIPLTITDIHQQTTEAALSIIVGLNGDGIENLYPTEADSYVIVVLGPSIAGDYILRIRNVLGKTVLEEHYNTNDLSEEKRELFVNVNSLYPGRYDLSIIASGKTYTQTFVKK